MHFGLDLHLIKNQKLLDLAERIKHWVALFSLHSSCCNFLLTLCHLGLGAQDPYPVKIILFVSGKVIKRPIQECRIVEAIDSFVLSFLVIAMFEPVRQVVSDVEYGFISVQLYL